MPRKFITLGIISIVHERSSLLIVNLLMKRASKCDYVKMKTVWLCVNCEKEDVSGMSQCYKKSEGSFVISSPPKCPLSKEIHS